MIPRDSLAAFKRFDQHMANRNGALAAALVYGNADDPTQMVIMLDGTATLLCPLRMGVERPNLALPLIDTWSVGWWYGDPLWMSVEPTNDLTSGSWDLVGFLTPRDAAALEYNNRLVRETKPTLNVRAVPADLNTRAQMILEDYNRADRPLLEQIQMGNGDEYIEGGDEIIVLTGFIERTIDRELAAHLTIETKEPTT